jgi:hypothetical protein
MTAYLLVRRVISLLLVIQTVWFARHGGSNQAIGAHAQRLVDFQVVQPPPVPHDAKQCTIQVFQYVHLPSVRSVCLVGG